MDTIESFETVEPPKPKIPFYVRRTFGEKMNACFGFIKENFKPLIKYCTYIILPLALIQAVTMNSFMSGYLDMAVLEDIGDGIFGSSALGFLLNYLLLIICYIVGSILITAMVYSLMQLYNSREQRLQGITFKDIKPSFIRNSKRMLILMLFVCALAIVGMIIFILFTIITPFTLLLTIPAFFACLVPLMLIVPIYMFEDINIINAFTKSLKLGFATWGGIFAISVITGLIASVVQGATTTPWYVATLVKYFFVLSEGTSLGESTLFEKILLYLLGIVQVYGMYISTIISIIGIMYQYSHSSDIIENTSIHGEIDNFEKL